jgi:hypothetical protein
MEVVMKVPVALSVVLLSLLQACASAPHTASLKPNIEFRESNQGQGVDVELQVVDGRGEKQVGRGSQAAIAADHEILAAVRGGFVSGLRKKGFTVVDQPSPKARVLRIDLQNLRYFTSPKPFSGVATEAVLHAVVRDREAKYEQTYRTETHGPVIATTSDNERQLRDTLGTAIVEVFRDGHLMAFLQGGPPSPISAVEQPTSVQGVRPPAQDAAYDGRGKDPEWTTVTR